MHLRFTFFFLTTTKQDRRSHRLAPDLVHEWRALPLATAMMLSIPVGRPSRKLRVVPCAPLGTTPATLSIEQSRDQRFDFARYAVCHERIADHATLSGEVRALR